MALAEKFRSTMNKVAESVQTTVDNVQTGYDPLPDDTSKKYYEITYGLLFSISPISFDKIKKYIEFHLKESCDDAKLLTILDKYFYDVSKHYETSTKFKEKIYTYRDADNLKYYLIHEKKIHQKTIQKLQDINNELEQKKSYGSTKEEILDICYKEFVDIIEAELDNILIVIAEYDDKEFLEDGIKRIYKNLEKHIPETIYNLIMQDLLLNRFYDGNPTITGFFTKYFLRYKVISKANMYEGRLAYFTSLGLRAIHFEKYENDRINYSSISDEECRDIIVTSPHYENLLKNHPFDKEEYIEKTIKEIKGCSILKGLFKIELDENSPEDNHFIDCMCNIAWKEVSKLYKDEATTAISITNMLFHYAKTEYPMIDKD